MASPYVADTSQLLANLIPLIQGNKQIDREDQLRQQQQKMTQDRQKLQVAGAQALELRDLPTFEQKRTGLLRLAQNAIEQGGDPTAWEKLTKIQDVDELNLALRRMAVNASDAGSLIDNRLKQESKARAGMDQDRQVQSSAILPGGVVQVVYKDGSTEVKTPEELSVDIVKRAEDRGVQLQQERAQGRGLGKDAAKSATIAFEATEKIRTGNDSLRKVIEEVKNGAETGPLASKMPSLRAASVRLDNLKNRLGLDVVSGVTFGALSEKELQIALDVAMPDKLDGPELIKWAEDKINAQEKLSSYLEDQAVFLSKKGKTVADWIELQRSKKQEQQTQPAPATGGIKFLGFE